MKKAIKWVEKLEWNEFRTSGLLWFVNRTLHLFGRAIVFDYYRNGKLKEVYYAKCKFRGFGASAEIKGFKAVTKFLKKNVSCLSKDTYL